MAAYLKEDYATAFAEFKPLAEQGDAQAQYRLGIMHNMGFGVPVDPEQAALWLSKAAEQNVAEAQYALGLLFEDGRGVKHSQADAMRWWRQAVALGSYDALQKLSDWGHPEPFIRSR